MARKPRLTPRQTGDVHLRAASPEFDELLALAFKRYPDQEWATFCRFGWRQRGESLVLTLAAVDSPSHGDVDDQVGHVALLEPYSLRMALAAEQHPLAVGVMHSHPDGCPPMPSPIDDDMDSYYSDYFGGFATGRPYVSLIVAMVRGELAISGRVFWHGEWLHVDRILAERGPLRAWIGGWEPPPDGRVAERIARLASAFGEEATAHLRRASVAVIGAGGTGSAAIEVLARAGVGRIVIVDPDHLEESNLERVHGSRPEQASGGVSKASVALEHVRSIDPSVEVVALVGALPQEQVLDAVATADVAIGCTDKQHSRLALSDLAVRYLVPVIDCGVLMEGQAGSISGQIIQLVRFLPGDPCALCRRMIVPQRLAQELMSDDERAQRRLAASQAQERGDHVAAYWQGEPQMNTVGYLTTTAGAMSAGYAIGWLTGRFRPPFSRLQFNLLAKFLDVTDSQEEASPSCVCRRVRGWADQAAVDALVTAPLHWPAVQVVDWSQPAPQR